MHPVTHAAARPFSPAYIMGGSGRVVSYRELDGWSNQLAHVWRKAGLRPGDVIAVLMENTVDFFPVIWSAQRAGLVYACLSTTLSVSDLAYILSDSGCAAVVVSAQMAPLLRQALPEHEAPRCFQAGGGGGEFVDLDLARQAMPETPIADEVAGADMLYSSGTTGRPKGVRRPLELGVPIDQKTPAVGLAQTAYGFTPDTIYLSPAPLYHAGPLRWALVVHRLGGTIIVMEKFDAETGLALIERYGITAAQFVPTHFIRMLRLPAETKARFDLSSLRTVFHAAAPCPVPVKQEMLAWWGPIIHEYYGGTESNGLVMITPQEWIAHPGSVGRAKLGEIRICDEHGEALPPRQEGAVYFADGDRFDYHNDPAKTAGAYNRHGWSTLGDIGWIDEEGFLYLTDRKSFMIISGGVNIYPQEIENLLITHAKVSDVAVIGAPDPEMGEKVVAVVEPIDWADAGEALADELRQFARDALGRVKAPRQIDFVQAFAAAGDGEVV